METTIVDTKNTRSTVFIVLKKRLTLIITITTILLFVLALLMRLYTLELPFDRDSYDEGVYLQTLRAMSAGHQLYAPTFYSQPPMFLLSVFPAFMLFGQTIWAARVGILLVSLGGLAGIYIFGKATRGWLGALAGLILYLFNTQYLVASQTLQAEAPQLAFTLLAIGFAYLWWHNPTGRKGNLYAALCTVTLALSIMSKLYGVSTLVPIGLLALAHCRRIFQQPAGARLAYSTSLLVGAGCFVLTVIILLVPFLNVFSAFWSGNITFHNVASDIYAINIRENRKLILGAINKPLSYVALASLIYTLWRRDWLVLPLVAWYGVVIFLLSRQVPLFAHHFVTITPPLICIAVMGLPSLQQQTFKNWNWQVLVTGICLLILVAISINGATDIRSYYRSMQAQGAAGSTSKNMRVAREVQALLKPGDIIVTDGQFVAALADHNTPPDLVDTSNVRIESRYVTLEQLINEAAKPEVKAVLFYTYRIKRVSGFRDWVQAHYHLEKTYGTDQELWIKNKP